MARDESRTESSWFWRLETLELAGAVAFEASPLAKLSCSHSGDKSMGTKFSNRRSQKQATFLGRSTVCKGNSMKLKPYGFSKILSGFLILPSWVG